MLILCVFILSSLIFLIIILIHRFKETPLLAGEHSKKIKNQIKRPSLETNVFYSVACQKDPCSNATFFLFSNLRKCLKNRVCVGKLSPFPHVQGDTAAHWSNFYPLPHPPTPKSSAISECSNSNSFRKLADDS